MTTFIPTPDTLNEGDALRRLAWREYADGLRDLEGRAYDDAEPAAWEQLQATLRRLDGQGAPA